MVVHLQHQRIIYIVYPRFRHVLMYPGKTLDREPVLLSSIIGYDTMFESIEFQKNFEAIFKAVIFFFVAPNLVIVL